MADSASDLWPAQGEGRLSALAFRSLGAKISSGRPSPGEIPHIPKLDISGTLAGAQAEQISAEPLSDSPGTGQADLLDGDASRALLDIMAATGGSAQPHERALAADMLARLVPRLPLRNLLALVERVCLMETAPALLVRELSRDRRIEVAGPLLERAAAVGDEDLLSVIDGGDLSKQRMIARRRTISQPLAARLVATGDAAVLLTLIRNPGASFSLNSFQQLCATAAGTPALQAPLATRTDTPAIIAFELFWCLPPQLRRYTLSRFLTDSENLNKITKIGQVVGVGAETPPPDSIPPEGIETFLSCAESGRTDEAVDMLVQISGVAARTARRIVTDPDGEPLLVVLKVLGVNRTSFSEAIDRLQASAAAALRGDRNPEELRTIFDSLSYNKARVVLTYWAWGALP